MSWKVSETAEPRLSRKSKKDDGSEGENIGLIPLFFIIKLQGDPGVHVSFGWPVVLCDVFVGMSTMASDGLPHENKIL